MKFSAACYGRRKLKALELTPQFLLTLLSGNLLTGAWTTDLPSDTRWLEVFTDPWTKTIVVVISSESFPETPEGTTIPRHELTLTVGRTPSPGHRDDCECPQCV